MASFDPARAPIKKLQTGHGWVEAKDNLWETSVGLLSP